MTEDIMMSVPYPKWRAMEARIEQLQVQVLAAQVERDEARMEDPSGRLIEAVRLVHASLRIIQYAVSNLPVTCYRGWPYGELLEVAKGIPKIPGLTDTQRELEGIFRKRAEDMEALELGRAAVALVAHELATVDVPNGMLCSICHEAQINTSTGVSCENGHVDARGYPPTPLVGHGGPAAALPAAAPRKDDDASPA